MPAPVDLVRSVPMFSSLSNRHLRRLANTFKESRFSAGETIAAEGRSGVGFFVIGHGEVAYSVKGESTGRGGPGDSFGEIALIDDGPRSATVTAESDVVAYGLTSWEFRPLVEENAAIAWELLLAMAARLRKAEAAS